jgi:transketolase
MSTTVNREFTGVAESLLPALRAAPTASCRDAYRATLLELAERDERIICLEADLGGQNNTFQRRFPDRYFNFGLAEANLVTAAAGLASTGLVPFVHTMANFMVARACEQIKLDVAYHRANVKLVASYGGIAGGAFGPTHHATEDLAILRSMPGLTIVNPADAVEAVEALIAAAQANGPWYIRLGRDPTPIVHREAGTFRAGTAQLMRAGTDAAIVASGQSPVPIALAAAEQLAEAGLSVAVLNVSTLKPLDVAAIAALAEVCGAIVTVEEHNVVGGLGSAVAEVIAEFGQGRLVRLGIRDRFVDQGGTYTDLLTQYGISVQAATAAVRALLTDGAATTTTEQG